MILKKLYFLQCFKEFYVGKIEIRFIINNEIICRGKSNFQPVI